MKALSAQAFGRRIKDDILDDHGGGVFIDALFRVVDGMFEYYSQFVDECYLIANLDDVWAHTIPGSDVHEINARAVLLDALSSDAVQAAIDKSIRDILATHGYELTKEE